MSYTGCVLLVPAAAGARSSVHYPMSQPDTGGPMSSATANRAVWPAVLRELVARILRAGELAAFTLLAAPRGQGRVLPATLWDRQYQTGHWQCFARPEELPRYAVIAGILRDRGTPQAVLDVGCGNGQLLTITDLTVLRLYHGVDLSGVAIDQARQRRWDERVTFEQTDFTVWIPPRLFDVIVFNEVLYYARRPVQVVGRYARALTEDGVIVISMFRHRNTGLIWRDLAASFDVSEFATIRNRIGEVVDIRLLRPRDASRVRQQQIDRANARAAPPLDHPVSDKITSSAGG